MNTFRTILLAIAAAGLSACASLSSPDRIVGAPVALSDPSVSRLPIAALTEPSPGPSITVGPILARDLQSAAFNLDEAVKIGALPASDPAPTCIHNVLRAAGLEGPASTERQSFEPKKDGLVSTGAILYVMARQAAATASQRITVSPECLQIIGQIQVDILRATGKVGAAALPRAITGGLLR